MTEVLTYEALKADRDAQQKRADALAVENENQRDWINKCSELWDAGCDLNNLLGLIPETPATDAALAAIRDEVLDRVIAKLGAMGSPDFTLMAIQALKNELREAK